MQQFHNTGETEYALLYYEQSTADESMEAAFVTPAKNMKSGTEITLDKA